ncbi:agmatinase [Colwellia psychrerythraea]|uniref:Agmatinase n=1 Tax=Colwellia psychrerythraea TaxID=28229 RepID=A0A099KCV5_COLPS|nr:agmatinase [Colwellia psychrerythraea]KGJ88564.1 agmatinase [Colwellia psychrerythraea]
MTDNNFNQPLGGNQMPRFGGPGTMFRLPSSDISNDLDIGILGVPLDIGASNRSGTRFGPRSVRNESVLVRPYGMYTKAAPFDSFQIADIGDAPINTFNLADSIRIIEEHYDTVMASNIKPVTVGGDHTISLPILRALHKKHGMMALVHVDAHADINDSMFGEKECHGTIFRRAIEEGLVDPKKMIQIGQRATGYSAGDFQWAVDRGVRVVQAEECWLKSLAPLMEEVREIIGGDTPTYLTFDIDGIDPAFAPGTGTPEPAGLTSPQALEIIRGMWGTNLIGADLVEVSPPYDTSGNTSLLAANLIFEMLCSFPGCIRR